MRRCTLLALVALCVVAVPAAASPQAESVTVKIGPSVPLKTVFDKTRKYRVVMSGLVGMATKTGTLTQKYDPFHGATDGNCTNSGPSVYLQIKDASGHLIDYSTAGSPPCRKDHRYEFVVNGHYPPAWDLHGKATAYITLEPDLTYWTVSGAFTLTITPESAGDDAGPSSAATKRLQQNLGKLGYYNGPLDGRAGAGLRAAVKAFQRQAGIPADGECSAACEAAIKKALGVGASPAVRSVLELQAALKRLGLYDGPLDGKGGPIDAAIKRFQIAVGIPADGTCDAQCQSALNKALGLDDPALPAGAPPTTATTVVQLQTDLRRLGFFNGPLDGKPGPALTAAVRDFQRNAGIPTDGRCRQRCQLELVKALSNRRT